MNAEVDLCYNRHMRTKLRRLPRDPVRALGQVRHYVMLRRVSSRIPSLQQVIEEFDSAHLLKHVGSLIHKQAIDMVEESSS